MKCYNIYFKGKKLNKYPISKQEMDKIYKAGGLSRQIANGIIEKYDISKLKVMECILV